MIDNRTVITGSINWSPSAAHQNDEVLLVIESPLLWRRTSPVRWIASGGGRSWGSTGDWNASWRPIAGAAAVVQQSWSDAALVPSPQAMRQQGVHDAERAD